MAGRIKRLLAAALAVFTLLPMAGCLSVSTDELYSLPQLSEKYLQLQELIDVELDKGAEYSAPTSGSYRQSVQLYDVDGDGRDEALAFFNASGTLHICVYRLREEDYGLAVTIEGEGTSIGSVEYADLNGDGWAELIVVWQLGSGIQLLKVYSLVAFNSAVLLTSDCMQFKLADMTGDARPELLVLRFDGDGEGTVDMLAFTPDGESEATGAKLSSGLETLQRVRTGLLNDGVTTALFVESLYDGGRLLTDVLAYIDSRLVNITADRETGVSLCTVRDYAVYCSDIDGDRVMELPISEQLPQLTEGGSAYSVFDWYGVGPAGMDKRVCSTYHCYNDGWYITLPEGWREGLAVRREPTVAGERAVVLSTIGADGTARDFLKVYTLTGENRRDRARFPGRVILREEGTTIYAAALLLSAAEWEYALGEEELKASFKPIYSEWITGAI